MADGSSFNNLVPGFDFLQGLVKNAGAVLPNMGQWVAPTLNPEELTKRIDELKTVQFWLEQNARMIGATIQALEVQRMTLSTLKTMNVQMGDLREAMKIRIPGLTEPAARAPVPKTPAATWSAAAPAPTPAAAAASAEAAKPAAPGVVDPMQWWGALTKQFTELATAAMKEGASGAARNMAGAMGSAQADAAAAEAQPADPDAADSATKSARSKVPSPRRAPLPKA